MQFKLIAATLVSLTATSVMANPLPNIEAAQGAEIMARAEQAEQAAQAKQEKQFFGGPNNWNNNGLGNGPGNGITAFGFGGGGVNIPNNGFNNGFGPSGCPQLQCWQCNGFNQGWGGGQCGWGQFQGCPCF